eukprot:CAMPEP_0175031920 /NCGR_PEP_ID=MMETSP0005-20121125/21113_1 /TAXON_ID=420556 /ORGANISM="Ochromonas sp., Strain CCMP1393" /LENGTH=1650 /DNA_ID=CAMNT_0016292283 /DNA_START=12 /DNA_END=4964 /DNA_ORIENTATION=+
MSSRKRGKEYSQVLADSAHGKFSIEDEEDDDVDIELNFDAASGNYRPTSSPNDAEAKVNGVGYICYFCMQAWSTLTFSWMDKLLKTGNEKPLEMEDLYKLAYSDSAEGVYKSFKEGWTRELNKPGKKKEPSLAWAFFHAFGTPFLAAAVLKFIHDSALFVGPQLLNHLINYLNDPTQPLSVGLMYVLGFFLSNLVMSLCLRQYFWVCYRVGMNLRSSVVTAIYSKSLVISVAALSRKTIGEITNLMSVDSARLQDLTPYLHAIWYSLYQVAVALYFLYQQMGISCLAGMAVVILTIPLTGRVSMYLKGLQKTLSEVRDERIKLTNEVLSGMKVIKLQAWEKEFENRIEEVRERELEIFKKYSIAVSMSGALYTSIPLMVAILTFITYIALGNELNVATALTSLALFDLLRFPLFMLPQVLNNVVEAKVSVDRVQNFLIETEKQPVSSYPLKRNGAMLEKATLVWESAVRRKPGSRCELEEEDDEFSLRRSLVQAHNLLKDIATHPRYYFHYTLQSISCGRLGENPELYAPSSNFSLSATAGTTATQNPMIPRSSSNSSIASTSSAGSTGGGTDKKAKKPPKAPAKPLSEEEFLSIVREAHVIEAERTIESLEEELRSLKKTAYEAATAAATASAASSSSESLLLQQQQEEESKGEGEMVTVGVDESTEFLNQGSLSFATSYEELNSAGEVDDDQPQLSPHQAATGTGDAGAPAEHMSSSTSAAATAKETRVLTLSRVNLQVCPGQLVSIVGAVGSGKSSMLSALLGDMRVCYGTVAVWGSVAYAAQVAFIQNSTLRENITYGLPFDEEKYQHTLELCALLTDIEVLPAGHETEIGERGINLSGGQKARLGLARAVYADADIYMLDDPLSAVDAHVGQHLFEQCIMDLKRRGKCVILVTNALQFLKSSSHILVLKDGRIAESGNYDSLLQSGGGFTEMIATMQETGSNSASSGSEADGAASASSATTATAATTAAETRETATNNANVDPATAEKAAAAATTAKNAKEKKEEEMKKEDSSKVSIKKSTTLISQEDREVGDVDMKVYGKWAMAAGGISVGVLIIIFFFIGECVTVLSSWWLSYWSEHRSDGTSPWYYLGIYIAINVGVVICAFSRELYVRLRAWNAGRGLFLELLNSVLFSPMAFFDTTPLGRVINRFSKDIYTIDEQIPQTVRMYLGTMAKVISTILYICIITPLFVIGLIPIFAFYYFAQRYYIRTSRELTRLENTSRSPIYALFSETLDGLTTIRAYKSERRLISKNNRLLDSNVQSYFLNFSANCWLAVRLEFAGTLIVTFAALFAVLARDSSTSDESTEGAVDAQEKREQFAGLAGLAISFAMSVTQSLNWTVRMASNMESQMVSVERVKSYTTMAQEAPHYLPQDPTTAADLLRNNTYSNSNNPRSSSGSSNDVWPSNGAVEMQSVAMRYREGLPLVLRGLTLSIGGREKVGIVGRTGAGKSSLLTALLRLVELDSGEIRIDGVNIATIGLNTLRSVMAVIPQDPVLFSGTIRSNLDPFHKYSDHEVWEGLHRTLLSDSITSLDDKVTENGSNFSVGQRQLLCIARALLSRAKIIIMDEATAAVDVETDAVIQQAIRTEFAHATCLTVAHRLNTIMDSDKVLVMDQGVAAEYDSPSNLLADDTSMFYSLVSNWESSK